MAFLRVLPRPAAAEPVRRGQLRGRLAGDRPRDAGLVRGIAGRRGLASPAEPLALLQRDPGGLRGRFRLQPPAGARLLLRKQEQPAARPRARGRLPELCWRRGGGFHPECLRSVPGRQPRQRQQRLPGKPHHGLGRRHPPQQRSWDGGGRPSGTGGCEGKRWCERRLQRGRGQRRRLARRAQVGRGASQPPRADFL